MVTLFYFIADNVLLTIMRFVELWVLLGAYIFGWERSHEGVMDYFA